MAVYPEKEADLYTGFWIVEVEHKGEARNATCDTAAEAYEQERELKKQIDEEQSSENNEALSRDDRREIERLQNVVREFQDLNENMPIQVINIFLTVALNEGKSLREMMPIAGVESQSTMSRHLIDLGERNRRKEPGYQLVTARLDSMELRKKQYNLTKEGREKLEKVLEIFRHKS